MHRILTIGMKETTDHRIHLDSVDGQTLEIVIQYLHQDFIINPNYSPKELTNLPRTVFQFGIAPDQVMDVLMASHFLDIPTLLSLSIYMLVHHFESIPSLDGIPNEIIIQIFNHLPPELLYVAEENHKQLNIDTSKIWEEKYNKLQNNTAGLISNIEGKNTNWRNLFMEVYLNNLIDKISYDKSKSVFESLFHFLKYCGSAIHSQRFFVETLNTFTIHSQTHPTLLDDYFNKYLPQIENLHFCSVNENLDYILRSDDCELLSKVLSNHIHLHTLSLTGLQLSDDHMTVFCSNLFLSLPHLTELDLSCNKIAVVGAKSLANLLSDNKFGLKKLNLFNNSVGWKHSNGVYSGLVYLLKSLENNKQLEVLNLGKNDITSNELWASLKINTALKVLKLHENPIGKIKTYGTHSSYHSQDLPFNTEQILFNNLPIGIEELDLTLTGLNSAHITTLVNYIFNINENGEVQDTRLKNLKTLILSGCEVQESMGICFLIRNNKSITNLDISNINIGDQGILLAESISSATESLLQSLNIRRTQITSNVSLVIANACLKAKLKLVNFDFNYIRAEVAEEISKLMKSNEIECILQNLSVPGGGRRFY